MFEGSTISSVVFQRNPIDHKDEDALCKKKCEIVPRIKMFSPRILVNRQNSRRRKKGEITNPANTLDGLVAKRIVDGSTKSLMKHYLSEKEAIEAPSEQQELLRSEADPDVSTRTCSICGYQGKWVSEMIRHKRVHTNERPFRCKYCSRTSKWKADLIRHVAKTHGIRVVSKYSRSKAFEVSTYNVPRNQENSECDVSEKQEMLSVSNENGCVVNETNALPCSNVVPRSYQCILCRFEQDSLNVLIYHLRSVHDQAPYSCESCGEEFLEFDQASLHFGTQLNIENCKSICAIEGESKCSKSSLRALIQPIYSESVIRSSTNRTTLRIIECNICPFKGTHNEMADHKQGHLMPKGFINYKCAFCNWYAKKKISIEKHMELHTKEPQRYMNSVERNLITPVALPRNLHHSGSSFSATNVLKPNCSEEISNVSVLLDHESGMAARFESYLYPFMKPIAEYFLSNDNKGNTARCDSSFVIPCAQTSTNTTLGENLSSNYEILMEREGRRSALNTFYQMDNQREFLFQYFMTLASNSLRPFRESKLIESSNSLSDDIVEGSDEADDKIDIEAV